jgi:hypothetical protein
MANDLINAVVVNQTGLPDRVVGNAVNEQWEQIVGERFVELSSFSPSSIGGYNSRQVKPQGLFVRSDYIPPTNAIEEMELAIRLYQEDDDVANTVGMMAAVAFAGMKNLHPDKTTEDFFNAIAYEVNMDARLRELYEQLLVASSVYQMTAYMRKSIPNFKSGPDPSLVIPAITYLNPLSIRIISSADFQDAPLAQLVDEDTNDILSKLYSPSTTAAEKNQIRKAYPLIAALYLGKWTPTSQQLSDDDTLSGAEDMWVLNPLFVKRYVINSNSAQSKYPQSLIRRVFGLCEAKRLLNIADWSLLSGAINYLVVVRKGSDKIPAHPLEIENLQGLVKSAARSGVMVGDHRLSVDLIMPDMTNMLDDSKRSLLGRKIAKAIMRLPDFEFGRVEGGGTPEGEIVSQVMSSDRLLVKRLVERNLYAEIIARNPSVFKQGSPKLWFPPITITGHRFFNDQILKLRDRGDISRSTTVETIGLDPEAEMARREQEKDAGFDEVMTAENVPSTGDNPMNTGRPRSEDQVKTDDTTTTSPGGP